MSDRLLIREQVTFEQALEMLDMAPPDHAGKIVCPFHAENTPSLQLYDDHYHCFGCGSNGDVVWFVACVTGAPLWKAEKYLLGAVEDVSDTPRRVSEPVVREVKDLNAQWSEVAGVEHGKMLAGLAEEYCQDRWGLHWEYVKGFAALGNDGIHIPYWHNSTVVGIKIRKWNGQKTSVTGSTFNLSPYLSWTGDGIPLALCEGEPDTWAMRQYTYSVGLPSGAGSYPDEVHKWIVNRKRPVWLALDADDAGVKATAKIADALVKDGVRVFDLSGQLATYGNDVCDALKNGWRPKF